MTDKNYIKRHLESVLANAAETFKVVILGTLLDLIAFIIFRLPSRWDFYFFFQFHIYYEF